MLKSAILFYLKLWKDLKARGFCRNDYNPCVANATINGKPMTVVWHVNDLKISHADPNEVTKMISYLKKACGDVTAKRGKHITYLGMDMDFARQDEVSIGMDDFTLNMLIEYKKYMKKIGPPAATPAGNRLFDVRPEASRKLLGEEDARMFHRWVVQLLYLSNRVRRDIKTPVAFLTTCVKSPDHDNAAKLWSVMRYLLGQPCLCLTLRADLPQLFLHWWVDAAFATHADFKGHTIAMLSPGQGSANDVSRKQKINTNSSTESELVKVHIVIQRMMWVDLFMKDQGYTPHATTLHQDNTSVIQLKKHRRSAAGQRTRHLNIRYFYIKDQLDQGWLSLKHCPTNSMIADFFTKPKQGAAFQKFRAAVMNCGENPPSLTTVVKSIAAKMASSRTAPARKPPQECVGHNKLPAQGARIANPCNSGRRPMRPIIWTAFRLRTRTPCGSLVSTWNQLSPIILSSSHCFNSLK